MALFQIGLAALIRNQFHINQLVFPIVVVVVVVKAQFPIRKVIRAALNVLICIALYNHLVGMAFSILLSIVYLLIIPLI